MSGLVVPSLAKEPEAVFIHGPCSCLYNYSAHRVGALDVGLIAALNYNCPIIVCFLLKESRMNKKPAVAFLLSTAFVFVAVLALVFWPSQSGAPVARGKSPAAPITQEMTPDQTLAQDLALSDTTVQGYTLGSRSSVYDVFNISSGYDVTGNPCSMHSCYQVNIYNYDDQAVVSVIVDVTSRQVLDVFYQPGLHPYLDNTSAKLAAEIIQADPQVQEILGHKPELEDIMPMDSSLFGTDCGAAHPCVAATFKLGDGRIMWAHVDLTKEEIAGIDWTFAPPETTIYTISEEMMACPPPPDGSVSRNGWVVNYGAMSGSDGFQVFDVSYQGREIIERIKLLQWHADYGNTGFQDSTGCTSGGGFMIQPYGTTVVSDIVDGQAQVIGFDIKQDFRMFNWGNSCNYRYEQHYQFYTDGRFRVVTGAFGKGCGTNAMYRPIVRIDLSIDGTDHDSFSMWNGTTWANAGTEFYRTPYPVSGSFPDGNGPYNYTTDGYIARTFDTVSGNGYYIEPSRGQFNDGSRGDDPFLYVTAYKANEGASDISVIGSCCNDNYQQGPHLYLNNESISDTDIVIWYVPQMLTDAAPPDYYCWTLTGEPNPETYPCWSGPMFVPYSSNVVQVLPGQPATYTGVHPNGGITTLNLPAGSVNVTTTLVYTPLQTVSTVPTSWSFADHAFELNAYQGGVLMPGFAFNQPMQVAIEYTENGVAGIDENTLQLMYWNGSAWVDAATTCSPASTYTRDTGNNLISVAVCHLTEFALFGQPTVVPSDDVYLPLLTKE